MGLKSGDNIVLDVPPSINLSNYQNKQVLVTGTYNKSTQILKVPDIAEITIYNTTVIPLEATTSSSPKP